MIDIREKLGGVKTRYGSTRVLQTCLFCRHLLAPYVTATQIPSLYLRASRQSGLFLIFNGHKPEVPPFTQPSSGDSGRQQGNGGIKLTQRASFYSSVDALFVAYPTYFRLQSRHGRRCDLDLF